MRSHRAQFLWELRALRRAHGVSEREVRTFERELDAQRLPPGEQYLRMQVENTPATADLDDMAVCGFERLARLYDPAWLRSEAERA